MRLSGAAIIVAGIALMLPACGGSSPTVPPPPSPGPQPPPTITFVPADTMAATNTITLTMTNSDLQSFTITIMANSVTDLFGVALDLVFDPTIVAFVDAEAGVFLDGDGVTVTAQLLESPAGRLIIALTRVGGVAGVEGSGVLYTLNFNAVTPGTTTLGIENAGAFDSTGASAGVEFAGGTIVVPMDSGTGQ